MKFRLISGIVLGLALCVASAQDATTTVTTQNPTGGQGQRGGRGRGEWAMMGAGHGTMGTVTEVAADHYTIKTESGETYTVHYSVNTRIMKQMVRRRRPAGEAQRAKATRDAGDRPAAQSRLTSRWATSLPPWAKWMPPPSPSAPVVIVQIDPERAKQMREMQANYGKTWLMGKVTAIDGVKVTLMGARRQHRPHPLSPTKTPPSASAASPSPSPTSRSATWSASRAR